MEALPSEIVLRILNFLHPLDIVTLQLVCRRFLSVARDNSIWRDECFEESSFLENLRRRRELLGDPRTRQPHIGDLQGAFNVDQQNEARTPAKYGDRGLKAAANGRTRIMANWDPSYPGETIDWYSEFIHRAAPISTSWFQQPRRRGDIQHEHLEVRGLGTYRPQGEGRDTLAVAPLDDGSVCLWDLKGPSGTKGRIVGRSAAGILSLPGPIGTQRSRMVSTGVTECVSIDSFHNKAYIAVQRDLVEVDLETLQAVSREDFPFSISALSEAKHDIPITVGTNLSLHLHDPRASQRHPQDSEFAEQLDISSSKPSFERRSSNFRDLLNPEPVPNYAPLFRPGPLSILHLPTSTECWDGNGEIYVAGRFPSILNYDRRYFPKLRGTIHSGARLCCLTSLPYPFAAKERDQMRRSELSIDEAKAAKALPGNTIVACGEYNSKGSLELYGLSPLPYLTTISSDSSAGRGGDSFLKNRQTSSNSKLLSVATHGTRIVFSDGGGNVKWVERDGFTEVRRWNVAYGSIEAPRGIFGTLGDSYMDSGSGDIVRKIIDTASGQSSSELNKDGLVLWTGEKIGLLSFSSRPGFTAADFEENAKTMEEIHREREERVYGQRMRRALERQADEVRFVRGLGLSLGRE